LNKLFRPGKFSSRPRKNRHEKTILAIILLAIACHGCANLRLDPAYHWRLAERRRGAVQRSIETIRRQRSDYEAVTVLARDGNLQGMSYYRLAQLESSLGNFQKARVDLLKALGSGLSAENQPAVLLALGDLLSRRLSKPGDASRVYKQIVVEHPGTPEAELAQLRLEELP